MPSPDQIFINGGGWRAVTTPDQLKSKVPSPDKISLKYFLKYLSGGTQGILNQKFW